MTIKTCFIDVDLTLIDIDNNLLPGVREGLEWMFYQKGYTLICWSAGGKDYAQRILETHKIDHLFDTVLDKPDMVIDDSPDSILHPHAVKKITKHDDWLRIKDIIFKKDTSMNQCDEVLEKLYDTREEALAAGKKYDSDKAPIVQGLFQYFPNALVAVAEVSKYGADKYQLTYADKNWARVEGGFERYSDALARHLIAEHSEYLDPESSLPHAAHAAWNALARLELCLKKK